MDDLSVGGEGLLLSNSPLISRGIKFILPALLLRQRGGGYLTAIVFGGIIGKSSPSRILHYRTGRTIYYSAADSAL
jgi:hypothetical protein